MSTSLRIVQKFFPNVTTVRDAKGAIVIEVTKHDADTSKKRNHRECAMAIACKRAFHADGVVISRSTAYLVKDNLALRFGIPPAVSREVTSFDRGAGFAPGTYQLSKPSRKRDVGGNTGKTGTGPKPKYRHITANIRSVLGGKDARV